VCHILACMLLFLCVCVCPCCLCVPARMAVHFVHLPLCAVLLSSLKLRPAHARGLLKASVCSGDSCECCAAHNQGQRCSQPRPALLTTKAVLPTAQTSTSPGHCFAKRITRRTRGPQQMGSAPKSTRRCAAGVQHGLSTLGRLQLCRHSCV